MRQVTSAKQISYKISTNAAFLLFIETFNHLMARVGRDHLTPTPLTQVSPTRSGWPHSAWPQTPLGVGNPQVLWAACFSAYSEEFPPDFFHSFYNEITARGLAFCLFPCHR